MTVVVVLMGSLACISNHSTIFKDLSHRWLCSDQSRDQLCISGPFTVGRKALVNQRYQACKDAT